MRERVVEEATGSWCSGNGPTGAGGRTGSPGPGPGAGRGIPSGSDRCGRGAASHAHAVVPGASRAGGAGLRTGAGHSWPRRHRRPSRFLQVNHTAPEYDSEVVQETPATSGPFRDAPVEENRLGNNEIGQAAVDHPDAGHSQGDQLPAMILPVTNCPVTNQGRSIGW